jgi:hypothetical protein
MKKCPSPPLIRPPSRSKQTKKSFVPAAMSYGGLESAASGTACQSAMTLTGRNPNEAAAVSRPWFRDGFRVFWHTGDRPTLLRRFYPQSQRGKTKGHSRPPRWLASCTPRVSHRPTASAPPLRKLTTQEALEQAGKMQIVPSYSASSPPFFEYRHNARLGCTTISGDHLVEEEESPLPQMRKVAPALD